MLVRCIPDAWVYDPFVDHNFDGVAEFKCPYTMADKMPDEMCKKKSFYLHHVNGIPCLKRGHAYYHTVNALSDMLPGNKDETKVIVSSGEFLMRAFKVLSF